MTDINSVVRTEVLKAVGKEKAVNEAQAKLDKQRASMYVHGPIAAQKAIDDCGGDREKAAKICEAVFETLYSDFRANRREIAVRHDCEQALDNAGNPKTDQDDNPVYVVPASLQTIRYVVMQGFLHGLDFQVRKLDANEEPKLDEDGNPDYRPATFSSLKTAAKAARDKIKAEKLKAEQGELVVVDEILATIRERIAAFDDKTLVEAAVKILQNTAEKLDEVA